MSRSDLNSARAGYRLTVPQSICAALGFATVALGAVVLLGWRRDPVAVFRLISSAEPMGADAALAFIACGFGILALTFGRWRLAFAGGAVAVLIGAAIGVQQMLGVDFRIDTMLIERFIGPDAADHGRMSAFAAVYFVISGVALLGATWRRSPTFAGTLALGAGAILVGDTAMVFFAAATDLRTMPGWAIVADKAPNTSIGFGMIGSALLLHGWWACRQPRELLPHWTACLVGAAVASIAVLFWQTLHQHEKLDVERMLVSEVNVLKEAFIDRMVMRIAPVMRIKGLWERGRGIAPGSWEDMAAGAMEEHPGFNAFVFFDRDYHLQRIAARAGLSATAPLGSPIGELGRAYLDAVRDGAALVFTEPVKLTDRAPEFLMLTGLYVDDQFEGFLGASFGYAPLFYGLIEERAKRGVGVSFRHGSYEVLRTSDRNTAAERGARAELPWPLMTQTYNVTAWLLPSSGMFTSTLPEIVLAVGMLIGAVLVAVVNAAVRARQRLAESERQYRDTFENAPVAMSWVGPDGHFVRINRAYREFLGYDADELAHMSPLDLAHPSQKDEMAQNISSILSGDIDNVSFERKFVRKNGESAWAQVSSAAIRDKHGRLSFVLTHVQDITARKMTEAQLFQAQKMDALGNLAGGIAHDFNNMLLPIIALTQVSQSELPEDHSVQENLSGVVEAAQQASHLVQRILTFSRQTEQRAEEIDVSQCIKGALDLISNIVPASLTIADEIEPAVGIVTGDETQLHSVIMNLASNAVDAMNGAVGLLRIGLTRVTLGTTLAARLPDLKVGAAYAKVTVQDSGCGMDQATIEKIFNPFFTTKPVGEGTGLGLAMVHGIVESLDGAIEVTSEPGVGSTFDIYLPLRDRQARASASSAA